MFAPSRAHYGRFDFEIPAQDRNSKQAFTTGLILFTVQNGKSLCLSGPVYTIPFSNENGTKSCRFGLPSTLKRFRNRHQLKTILKTARFENGMKRFSVNA